MRAARATDRRTALSRCAREGENLRVRLSVAVPADVPDRVALLRTEFGFGHGMRRIGAEQHMRVSYGFGGPVDHAAIEHGIDLGDLARHEDRWPKDALELIRRHDLQQGLLLRLAQDQAARSCRTP